MSTDLTTTIEQVPEPLSVKVNTLLSPEERNFELVQRKAKALSQSTLIPKDYQNNLPNCMIAMDMAERMDTKPLIVMQNLYIVHGRPTWKAEFLIATAKTSGLFSNLRYQFIGEDGKDSYGCFCSAVCNSTGEVLEGTKITIAMAKAEGWFSKSGSKWQTMPEQMLRYRAASFFVRAYAPELSLGLATREEVEDSIDGEVISRQGRLVKSTAATA